VTEIVKLDNFNALEAAQMVKPFVDSQGIVVANAKSNTLVVVDYASNLPRILSVVSSLDRDVTRTETLALKNIPATELQTILTTLHQRGGEESFSSNFTVVAAPTGNSIVVRGDDVAVSRALSVAQRLDQADRVEDTLRVIPLNNADAAEVVPILEKVADAISVRRGDFSPDSVPSTIAHHAPSNSLVISAPTETLLTLERVITDLDKRRAQVLVEAIIVEMSDDTARELGLQFLLSGTGNSSVPFATTNYSRSAPNLLALAGAISTGTPAATGSTNPFTSSAINSLLGLSGLTVGGGGRERRGGGGGLLGGGGCSWLLGLP
jgi:general secretion pathway protein D